MPDTTNQNGQFNPLHAAHAIEQVMLTLQFDQPVDNAIFGRVREAAGQFRQELPGEAEIHGLTFPFGPDVRPPINSGISFRRAEPDGTVGQELRVDRTSLSFITTRYTRWNEFWTQASRYFNVLAPIYAGHARLAGVGCTYVDKFVWSGNTVNCRPALLLRGDSKYICPHVFTADDLWHSYTGAFIRVDRNTKRLLNVNVDHTDELRLGETRRIVAITTVLSDQLNQAGYDPCTVTPDTVTDFINTRIQALHVFSKVVFGNIINDTMSRRIALIE